MGCTMCASKKTRESEEQLPQERVLETYPAPGSVSIGQPDPNLNTPENTERSMDWQQ